MSFVISENTVLCEELLLLYVEQHLIDLLDLLFYVAAAAFLTYL